MIKFNFYNPTHLLFGSGALDALGKQSLPGRKALLMKFKLTEISPLRQSGRDSAPQPSLPS